jgi:hypothetical protein
MTYEPLLFIPKDSVCIPHTRYGELLQQIETQERFCRTYGNNLQWILEYANPNELGKSVIQAWIRELTE